VILIFDTGISAVARRYVIFFNYLVTSQAIFSLIIASECSLDPSRTSSATWALYKMPLSLCIIFGCAVMVVDNYDDNKK
jgi:hypothetical protein